jgi:hypothetical protein
MAFSNQVFDNEVEVSSRLDCVSLCVKTSHTAVGLYEQRKLKTLTLYGLQEKS